MLPVIDQLTGDELRKILLEQQAILDNATVGILFSRDRKLAACNSLCAEMFGYTVEEMTGLSGMALYPSEQDYWTLGQQASPILAKGKAFHAEIQYRRKNASLFWGRISAKAVDPHNPPGGTIWIIEDVSDEHAVREALARATHELEAVFETSMIGISVLRNQVVQRCNRRFEEILGYSPGELTGRSTRQCYLSQEEYEQGATLFQSDLLQGNVHQSEQLLRRKDGSTFWAGLSARAFNQSKPDDGLVWMIEDITDRKQADERVRAALAEQELIFNNAAVGMMFVRNRIVSRCNRKFAEIFGYAEHELIGNSTLQLYPTLHDYDADGIRSYAALKRGDISVGELHLRRKDSSLFWVRATGRRIESTGPGLDVIWIFEDVTERHQAEEALARAHDELEQRVVARTTELASTNQQLQAEIYERMQAEQRIWHVAHHDALTGLPNRSLLFDRLEQGLTQAARSEHRLAMMFLDLDRFKSVNDTLGHHIGDQLLKHVAERLRETVRAADTVSRLGGDEFVVVLHEIQYPEDAKIVAEKIIATLAFALQVEGHTLHATPSIGISIYPDDGTDAYTLMKNADTAMYHAKENGRNTYQFFTDKMNEEAKRIFTLEQRMRSALDQNQFVLYYQPLIDHRQQTVCGMEVLLRWQDPEHGLLLPNEFIPIAEETGMILPLGEWVLREACRQSIHWQAQGYPAVPIAVNLSPRQFRQKNLVESIRSILAETGLPAQLLELEITESSLMHDADETLAKLHALTNMGIRLAVDDFGTGYSSLAYLKRFTVHKLKIDQSFVHDLCSNRDDASIVSAIIAMASNLGLNTLAEGVETEAQLKTLLGYGCHHFQGYLLSHPLPARDVAKIFQPPSLTPPKQGVQGSLALPLAE